MKFLLVHNYYQHAGGEDRSFESEVNLLRQHGHDVITYTRDNDDIHGMPLPSVALKTIWNRSTYREVLELIDREKPALMHCTNTFPLISPSVYYAAKKRGVPVVQSLRNYRYLCVNASLYRDDAVCEKCLKRKFPIAGVLQGCYRGSRSGSAVVAGRNYFAHLSGTWKRKVDLFFTPTEFTRNKFIEAGFDGDRIHVKPNFLLPDPGPGAGDGDYALFVGRLSPEKGIATLLEAWRQVHPKLQLKIIGTGPLNPLVQAAQDRGELEWLGQVPPEEVVRQTQRAKLLVMPSNWYETFGRVVMESFACGTPVVVAAHGAMYELMTDQVNGMSFRPLDHDHLAKQVNEMLADPQRLQRMRIEARRTYESRFTPEINYCMLMNIYQNAMQRCGLKGISKAEIAKPPAGHGSSNTADSIPVQKGRV